LEPAFTNGWVPHSALLKSVGSVPTSGTLNIPSLKKQKAAKAAAKTSKITFGGVLKFILFWVWQILVTVLAAKCAVDNTPWWVVEQGLALAWRLSVKFSIYGSVLSIVFWFIWNFILAPFGRGACEKMS
jgi:hypothetical protein